MTISRIDSQKAHERFSSVVSGLKKYNPDANTELLWMSYKLSSGLYSKHTPADRNDMLAQVLEVCEWLLRMRMDGEGIAAALLQPALDEKLLTSEYIAEHIGPEIEYLAKGVQKLFEIKFHSRKSEQAEAFRRMFLAMSKDIRMILVRLAQRIEKQNRGFFWEDKERLNDFSLETRDVYAPIANRLGIHWMKAQMEEQCFRVILPEDHQYIYSYIDEYRKDHQADVDEAVEDIKRVLSKGDIKARVFGRIKQNYSIYLKMKEKRLQIDEVPDIIAFRIIVPSIEDCYKAVGSVHTRWKPLPGGFEDYIAMPKPNGYQSLHTLVLGSYGERMEIQIRTEGMNNVAENGVAAHWVYKEGGKLKPEEIQKTDLLRNILGDRMEGEDPTDIFDSLKVDLFPDSIFIFTPQGDVQVMRHGSTALDFAYAVHTELGHHCAGAKVNKRIVPLRHELVNGDVVEVISKKTQKPKREWLDFVQSSRAKTKIRHSIRSEERERNREIGRTVLEKEFKDHSQNLNRLIKQGKLIPVPEKFKARDIEEVFMQIGYGKINPRSVLHEAVPGLELPEEEPLKSVELVIPKRKRKKKRRKSGLRIEGLNDIMTQYGKCCNPVHGDKIVGFVTRGRGVTIHRSDCSKLKTLEKERIVSAWWEASEEINLPVRLKIGAMDKPGILSKLSGVFTSNSININSAHVLMSKDGVTTCTFGIEVNDLKQLEKVSSDLMRQKGVFSVNRVAG